MNALYGKENCIDSDLKTKCKSAIFENPANPSGFTLELQGPYDVEIKSMTIYSPLEDREWEPAGRAIKVESNSVYLSNLKLLKSILRLLYNDDYHPYSAGVHFSGSPYC